MANSNMNSSWMSQIQDRTGSPATDSIQAILLEDHAQLDRLFRSIVAVAESADQAELRAAWRGFEDDLTRHLDVEEEQIFPAFADEQPDEARRLIEEHAAIRAKLTEMGVDLDLHCLAPDRIRSFIDALYVHARREDELFYPWANQRPVSRAPCR